MRQAKERTAESELHISRLEEQRPEVSDLSAWARRTYERNHLTELFIASRK